MADLNFDELEPVDSAELVAEPPRMLDLDELDKQSAGQVTLQAPTGELDLDSAQMLEPAEGTKPGLAMAAERLSEMSLGPQLLRAFGAPIREPLGGLEEAVVRGPLQAAGGAGKLLGHLRTDFPEEPSKPYSAKAILQSIAGAIPDVAYLPTEAVLKGLGKVEDWLTENGGWIERRQDATLMEDVYRGLGQAGGFIASGLVGASRHAPAAALPTVMGALQEAGAMQEEAEAYGATPDQQAIAMIAGSLLGSTEGVTGGVFLNRINRATGGKLWGALEKVGGVNAQPNVLKDTIVSFLTEFGQEGLQTVGENVTAADLAGYDPERKPGDEFWRSAGVGGIVGALIGGGASHFERRNYERQKEQAFLQAEIVKQMFPGINSIGGIFTPLSIANGKRVMNLLETQIEWGTVDEKLRQKEDDALGALLGQNVPDLASELRVYRENQDLNHQGMDVSSFSNSVPDPELNPASLLGRTTLDALVVGSEPIVYEKVSYGEMEIVNTQASLQAYTDSVQDLEQLLADPTYVANSTKEELKQDKELIKNYKNEIARLKKDIAVWQRSRKAYLALLRKSAELSLDIAKKMGYPDVKIWVAPETSRANSAGAASRVLNVKNAKGEEQKILFLELTPKFSFKKLFPTNYGEKPLTGAARQEEWLDMFETVVHESGHHFSFMKLADLYNAYAAVEHLQQTAPPTASLHTKQDLLQYVPQEVIEKAQAYAALVIDYRNFINEAQRKLSGAEFMIAQRGLEQGARRATWLPDAGDLRSLRDRNYDLSFDEYVAHRFEKAAASLQTDAMGKSKVTNELERVLDKHFFRQHFKAYEEIAKEILTSTSATAPHGRPYRRGATLPVGQRDQALDLMIQRLIVGGEAAKIRELLVAGGGKGRIDALQGKVIGLDPRGWAGLQEQYDRFTRTQKWFLNLTQIAEQNPHIEGLQTYLNTVANLWAPYSRHTYDRAVQTLGAWNKLAKEGSNRVTEVLMEEAQDGAELPPSLLAKRLNQEEQEVYFRVRRDLNFMLDEMQRVTEQQAREMITHNAEELNNRLAEIQEDFQRMKDKGYFPYMRFGEYTLSVRAGRDMTFEGQEYKKGQLISWESFDHAWERNKAERELSKTHPDLITSSQMRTDVGFSAQGLPKVFLQALKERLEASEAKPEVMEQINQAIVDALPIKSFKRQFLRKRGIKGFSKDFQRSYAAYMRMGAAHISRVEFAPLMQEGILRVKDDLAALGITGTNSGDARSRLVNWLQGHFDYIMNPGNELQALRAAGFFWFMGYHVKSAVLNLFQIPVVGLPYLQGRFGDAAAVKALGQAQVDVVNYWKNRDAWVSEARTEEDRKLTYAQLVGPLQPASGVFALDGSSQAFNLKQDGKFYDLTRVDLVNLHKPGEVLRLLNARLARENRELVPDKALVVGLQQAIQAQQQVSQALTPVEFDLLKLGDVLQELGLDGLIASDGQGGTTVSVRRRLERLKEITQKQAKQRSLIEPGRKGEIVRMLQRLQHMGVTDQSLAMELAVAASENKTDRLAPINAAERAWYSVSAWGALPFHVTEKLNRQIMAIAAYNLARNEGLSVDRSVGEAVLAVRTTMYEYSNWNRPMFMWGKKSVLFLFMNYVQNTAYFSTRGNKAALRFWLMLALLAGLEGLPFAKDLEDMIDFAVTGLSSVLGVKNPKFVLRHEMREWLEQMRMNPDLILHGFGQSSFGLPFASQLVGIPMPSFDFSSSIGMGDVIPGTNLPNSLMTRGWGKSIAGAASELGGAGVTAMNQAFNAMLSDSPDKWRRLEKMIPVAARNVSQAARWATQGQEQTASGDIVAQFDPFDTRDAMELIGKSLGFTPTRVSRGWESLIAEREIVEFYRLRQAKVLRDYAFATDRKDREGIADAWKEVEEYNSIVPYPEMKLDADTLKASVRQYINSQGKAEAGVTGGKKFTRLQEEVRATYKNPAGEGTSGSER